MPKTTAWLTPLNSMNLLRQTNLRDHAEKPRIIMVFFLAESTVLSCINRKATDRQKSKPFWN